MKKLFLCTCNKTLNKWLDYARIEKEMGSTFDAIHIHDALCLEEGLTFLDSEVSAEDSVVIGACTSQIITDRKFSNNSNYRGETQFRHLAGNLPGRVGRPSDSSGGLEDFFLTTPHPRS